MDASKAFKKHECLTLQLLAFFLRKTEKDKISAEMK